MASFTIIPANGLHPYWTTPLMNDEGLTDHRGAEVIGLDFARPIDRETRAALNRSLIDHHMLIMLDRHMNERGYLCRRMLKGEVPA
jgi:alpha-ketoglutarate-dependent taurine dioxygenase